MEFNNREIASFAVLALFILFVFYKSKDRKELLFGLLAVLKHFFVKQIFVTVILFSVYIYCEILFLYKIGFIETSMIKESIFWSLGAFGLIINHQNIVKEEKFVRKLILDNLKLLALFEFIYNMYTFNLFVEIILISIGTFLIMVKIVISNKDLNKGEALLMKIIDFILGIIVIITIIFAISHIYRNYNEINVIQNIKSFFLPLVMIILYIPFYYLLLLYAKYEMVFVSVNFFTKNNKENNSYLKRKIFVNCFLSYRKLKNIHTKLFNFQGSKSKQDINNIWDSF